MTSSLLAALRKQLACAALLSAVGCTMCPGGLLVKDHMTESSAQSDAMDCVNAAHDTSSDIDRKMFKKADRERWEQEALARCMREHGYLSISEGLMLHPEAKSPGASCSACSQTRVGSLTGE
jgi:hypothetical protein